MPPQTPAVSNTFYILLVLVIAKMDVIDSFGP